MSFWGERLVYLQKETSILLTINDLKTLKGLKIFE